MGRFHGSNHHGPAAPSVWPRKLSIYIHLLRLVNIIYQKIFHSLNQPSSSNRKDLGNHGLTHYTQGLGQGFVMLPDSYKITSADAGHRLPAIASLSSLRRGGRGYQIKRKFSYSSGIRNPVSARFREWILVP